MQSNCVESTVLKLKKLASALRAERKRSSVPAASTKKTGAESLLGDSNLSPGEKLNSDAMGARGKALLALAMLGATTGGLAAGVQQLTRAAKRRSFLKSRPEDILLPVTSPSKPMEKAASLDTALWNGSRIPLYLLALAAGGTAGFYGVQKAGEKVRLATADEEKEDAEEAFNRALKTEQRDARKSAGEDKLGEQFASYRKRASGSLDFDDAWLVPVLAAAALSGIPAYYAYKTVAGGDKFAPKMKALRTAYVLNQATKQPNFEATKG